MSDNNQPWYIEFFNSDYQSIYSSIFEESQITSEVNSLINLLGFKQNDSILDLCSGPGRHSLLLSKLGFNITAVDLNAEYLTQIVNNAKINELTIKAVRSDMRYLPFYEKFDLIINMFTSFGYLENDKENLKVLRSIYSSLKPKGLLLLDMLNREWVIANNIKTEWKIGGNDQIIIEHRNINLMTSKSSITFSTFQKDGSLLNSIGHHIRLYTLTEMIQLLEKANIFVKDVYGGLGKEPYSINSHRMIIVAQKSLES